MKLDRTFYFVCVLVVANLSEGTSPAYSVRWYAPFLAGGGYCSEAISYTVALSEYRHSRMSLGIVNFAEPPKQEFTSGLGDATRKVIRQLLQEGAKQRNLARDEGQIRIAVCHSTPDAWVPSAFPGWDDLAPCPPPDADISIGRTMYETNDFPQAWIPRLKRMSQIWVPTSFHQAILVNKHELAEDRVKVVHQAVNTDFFRPFTDSLKPDSTFRFLSIFKWEYRKGWDVLIKAFCLEFDPLVDDVELVIKTNDFYLEKRVVDIIANFAKAENFSVVDKRMNILEKHISEADLPKFYSQFDAYVTATRGEGWGRPIVEAMSMGLPVIATNYSGPTEFLNERNGYPLTIDGLALQEPGIEGHKWAIPSLKHMRKLLRHIVSNPTEARMKGDVARQDMVNKFSPPIIAKQLIELFDEISHKFRGQIGERDEL